MSLKYSLGLVFVIIATIQDIKEYKIKNRLILTVLIMGLMLSTFTNGIHGLADSVLGMITPLVLFPLFALRMIGAGDIKAFCALGAIVGIMGVVELMILSFLSGGIIALGFVLFRKNGINRFRGFFSYLKLCVLVRKPVSYNGVTQNDAVFRFAYAIAAGYVLYIILTLLGKI